METEATTDGFLFNIIHDCGLEVEAVSGGKAKEKSLADIIVSYLVGHDCPVVANYISECNRLCMQELLADVSGNSAAVVTSADAVGASDNNDLSPEACR